MEVTVNELKRFPNSAGLSSRGVARKEPCWVPPAENFGENKRKEKKRYEIWWALVSADWGRFLDPARLTPEGVARRGRVGNPLTTKKRNLV